MKPFARVAFRFIVHLYPSDFRTEFGDEMLWIFDEQMMCYEKTDRSVLCTRLLLDALCSAFLQHTARARRRPAVLGPLILQMDFSACLIQVTQMGFIAFCCLFSIFCISLFVRMVISSL
jgi:hypothetical protein